MSGVRPDERRRPGAMRGVRRTLQPLKSLETVEADSVQAREARHEAQCPGVKTEDVCPEAEAEARPVHSCQVIIIIIITHLNILSWTDSASSMDLSAESRSPPSLSMAAM